ncbi:MAG: neutral zinc metallopeptidase, partial [Rhodospirillaceae bacterium]
MELDNDESSNIEDRRGEGGGFGGGFGGGGFGGGGFGGPGIPIPLGGGLFKGGFGLIAIVVIGLILGVNPLALLGLAGGGESSYVAPPSQTRTASRPSANADPETQFVARVLKSTETVWGQEFQ